MNRHTTPPSDEISLVDIAVLLVKRWKLMLVTFLVILLAAVAFALLRPASYAYTSLYAVAQAIYRLFERARSGLEQRLAGVRRAIEEVSV
ncbi:MAG: hypothetical protein UMU75_11565 [Halomonas sp.]|nr:hypothetical protein [Halomonas sp.]